MEIDSTKHLFKILKQDIESFDQRILFKLQKVESGQQKTDRNIHNCLLDNDKQDDEIDDLKDQVSEIRAQIRDNEFRFLESEHKLNVIESKDQQTVDQIQITEINIKLDQIFK